MARHPNTSASIVFACQLLAFYDKPLPKLQDGGIEVLSAESVVMEGYHD